MDQEHMQDRRVSLTGISAIALWVTSLVLVLTDMFTEVNSGDLGIVAAAGAGTLTIRGYFVDLAARERNAFDIGRDSARRQR
jgi:hypothetical protein